MNIKRYLSKVVGVTICIIIIVIGLFWMSFSQMSRVAALKIQIASLECDMIMKNHGFNPTGESALSEITPFSATIRIQKSFVATDEADLTLSKNFQKKNWAFKLQGNKMQADTTLIIK